MRQKLTNEIVDQRLIKENRNIKRLENIEGSAKKRKWQCLIENCKHIWEASPNNILNAKNGCPKCADTRLTNDIVDQKLKNENRNIILLENYINAKTKRKWQCLICRYIWRATPDSILIINSGCPKCAGNIKLTNEDIDRRLIERNIKRLNDVNGTHLIYEWQCLICEYMWKTTAHSILNGHKTDCPNCYLRKNEKLIGKILNKLEYSFVMQKNIRDFNPNENKSYRFDYYLNDFNIAIEYNGIGHYKPTQWFGAISKEQAELNFINQQKRDEYKRTFCENHHIKLIEIDGRKYKDKKLEKYIIDSLSIKGII